MRLQKSKTSTKSFPISQKDSQCRSKDHGKTKVAVIDFANLDGSSAGELGKYIAEQMLTVTLFMTKHDFLSFGPSET